MAPILPAVRAYFRGFSQIFLAQNALSGLLVVCAMALSSWQLAALAMLGSAVQLAFATAQHVDGTSRGLMGYNGALVGAAAAASGAPLHIAATLTVAGAAAVIPLQQVFDRVPRIPAVTAPFCIVAGLLFGPLGNLWETTPPVSSPQLSTGLTSGLFDGFSEVVLADGIVPGLIILAALCVASVQVGGFALVGSALGLALAWAVHADVETVSTGMFNYSAVLTAIAVGTVLWPRASWAARLAGAAAGVVLTLCIQWAMSGLPVPTYTWPFVITAWIFALLPTPAEHKRG